MEIYRLDNHAEIIAMKHPISKTGANNRFALKVHVFSDKNGVLFQKSTFSATKIATGRTDGLRTNIRLTIVLLLKSIFLATKLGVQVQNLNGIVQIAQ